MLHLSVHVCPFTNAKLESYLLEVLAGEHTQVDYGLNYLKIFLSWLSLDNAVSFCDGIKM